MARCAGAHACCKSLNARVRASINVPRRVRFSASCSDTAGAVRVTLVAASCCASTDLLSHPRATSSVDLLLGVSRRSFGGSHSHQIGMGGDMALDDLFGLRH
jgi:hypothetical protein